MFSRVVQLRFVFTRKYTIWLITEAKINTRPVSDGIPESGDALSDHVAAKVYLEPPWKKNLDAPPGQFVSWLLV